MVSSIKSVIPRPVRNQLIRGKWFLKRLPCAIQYQNLLLRNAPLEKLVAYLPTPSQPRIYWTELKNIRLHGSLPYPPTGHYCMDGNWDLEMIHSLPSIFEPVAENVKKWDVHETIRSIFISGNHYSDTPQYKSMEEAIRQKSPNPPQGCHSIQAVNSYFEQLIAAYKSMREYGYLTQQEMGRPNVEEMRLHLTRDGQLCLGTGGNHRIRIAELLGIKWLPFLLRGIHPQFLLKLCQKQSLLPHEAIDKWLNDVFYDKRPV